MRQSDPTLHENGLIFPWKTRPLSIWRLLPGLLLCTSVLALLALIFKVATPAPGRVHAQGSQTILLLNSNLPTSQGLLNRALDRGALLLGTDDIIGSSADSTLLPLFEPSFARFEPRLKDPVNLPTAPPRQRIFSPNDLALPPIPSKVMKRQSSAPMPAYHIEAVWHGALSAQALASPPALSHLRPRDLARLRFQVAVTRNGRVTVVAPIAASLEDRDLLPAFQSGLSQCRFHPRATGDTLWGEVTFVWKRADSPAGP